MLEQFAPKRDGLRPAPSAGGTHICSSGTREQTPHPPTVTAKAPAQAMPTPQPFAQADQAEDCPTLLL